MSFASFFLQRLERGENVDKDSTGGDGEARDDIARLPKSAAIRVCINSILCYESV